jgi:3-hydroxy-9,10-secoandrosta-1,3,5(10)-triene-9,17-dione monooxygenase
VNRLWNVSTFCLGVDIDAELVERATNLAPLLAEHADRTELERQVVPEVMRALEDAGLFEVIVPKRVGGLGASMATQLRVAAELGKACAATAWVQSLLNITTWATTRAVAAKELFAGTERPRVCGVLMPSGTATPVDGGYRVSGKWGFASGSFYATWFTGGVEVVDQAGQVTGIGMVLVPRNDFDIEDTWFVAGMNGTASSTVVLDDVFVPAHRLTPLGEEAPEGSDPADLWPLGSALSVVLTGPLLGAAQACAETVTEKAPRRALSYTSYAATTESMVALAEIARARLDIDTAWMHALGAAGYIDGVGNGAPRDALQEARVRGQCGYLLATLRQGVDTLLNVGGAGSFASANVLQRHWRDLNVGSRHAFLATNLSLETYGRALYGLEPVVVLV